MGFEKFEYKPLIFVVTEPIIKITNKGVISINVLVLQKYFTGKSHAILFYDKDKGLVGFMPTNDTDEEGAVKLMNYANGQSKYLNTRSFCRYIEKFEKGVFNYTPYWNKEHNMVIIDLKDPIA